jgi:hypothetical protein
MRSLLVVIAALFLLHSRLEATGPAFEGAWKFVPAKSTDIAAWDNSQPQLDISTVAGNIRIVQGWVYRGKIAYADTFQFHPGGDPVTTIVRSEVWPGNWFMGVLSSPGDPKTVQGVWVEEGRSLRLVIHESVRTSQGKAVVKTTADYALGTDGKTITVTEKRSSRPTPVVLLFERKEPSR